MSGFFLAPKAVMNYVEADERGDAKAVKTLEARLPKNAWMYGLVLIGETQSYSKEKLMLFEPRPCGSELQIESGVVRVDHKAGIVHIALKVTQDGKIIDFIANGNFPIRK